MRYFDAEAFHGRCTDLMVFETADLIAYNHLIEALRDLAGQRGCDDNHGGPRLAEALTVADRSWNLVVFNPAAGRSQALDMVSLLGAAGMVGATVLMALLLPFMSILLVLMGLLFPSMGLLFVLMGLLFAGEWLVRRRVRGNIAHG